MQVVQPLWKTVWRFLTKLNVLLPRDPAIVFLRIWPNESNVYVHTKNKLIKQNHKIIPSIKN